MKNRDKVNKSDMHKHKEVLKQEESQNTTNRKKNIYRKGAAFLYLRAAYNNSQAKPPYKARYIY